MEHFKVGDIVALKSGSPSMTVINPWVQELTGHEVLCVWFFNGENRRGYFPETALKLTKEQGQDVIVERNHF